MLRRRQPHRRGETPDIQTGILLFCLSCLSPDLLQAGSYPKCFVNNIFPKYFLQAGSYPKYFVNNICPKYFFAGRELSEMCLRLPRLSGWRSTHVSRERTDHGHRSRFCLNFYLAVFYLLVALLPRTGDQKTLKALENSYWSKVSEFIRAEHFCRL